MKLHNLIFFGMAAGLVVGVLLWLPVKDLDATQAMPDWFIMSVWWLNLFGTTLFMGALKMIIAPLIFASIVAGVTSLPDMKELGAIGWKTLAYYAITTTIAVAIGLAAVLTIQPGKKAASVEERELRIAELKRLQVEYEAGVNRPALDEKGGATLDYSLWLAAHEGEKQTAATTRDKYQSLLSAKTRTPGMIFKEDIIQPILMNPFASLSSMNALGIIFFALLLGVACTVVGGTVSGQVIAFFQGLNAVMMKITMWLMQISPLALGCIVAELVAEKGLSVFVSLGWYCGTVIGGILVHLGVLVAIAALIAWIEVQEKDRIAERRSDLRRREKRQLAGKSKTTLALIKRSRYLTSIMLLVVLTTVASTLVDYQFNAVAEKNYQGMV
ncbi:hypothetical protein LCGC14_2726290, partial [marine sediment metagenome]